MSALSTPSPECPMTVFFDPRKCLICYRPAYCNNYGVLTCDACKMFFRRVVTEKLIYECKYNNFCFLDFSEEAELPKCKACRFQRCVDFGMNYVIREKKKLLGLKMKKENDVAEIIGGLLYRDSHRSKVMTMCFTIKNPSLEEMSEKVDVNVYVKPHEQKMSPQDWSFFALYTSVNFFLDLDFMKNLQTSDKLILLRHSASKCSLFGGAMRTYREKRDRMCTVDGQDIYPDAMRNILGTDKGSDVFLNRIRSFVVCKLVELGITTEEYILICVIVFCNPALFQYCLNTYQQNGPTRFSDLLSLCPLIQRNFEDLQYLTIVFRTAIKGMPIKFRKIVEELV